MKKEVVIFAGATAVFVLIALAGSYFLFGKKGKSPYSVTPTPGETNQVQIELTPAPLPLSAILVEPADRAENVEMETKLTLSFNRNFDPKEVSFTIDPPAAFSLKPENNLLRIVFDKLLLPGTTYTYTLKFTDLENLPQSFSFMTAGIKQSLPDTQPAGAAEKEEAFQRQNHPDVFLSNASPYETIDFAIDWQYKEAPTGHFAFTVNLLNPDPYRAKQAALDWMKSLGLTDEQIVRLDITYK